MHRTARATLRNKLRTLALLTALFGAAAFASGCIVEADPGPFGSRLADMEVQWTIAGVDAASLCDAHGVKTWIVELRGPEHRDVVIDCRANYWTTENDLLMLSQGFYDVRVIALDSADVEIARLETPFDLFDSGRVEVLHFDFSPAQFR